MGASHSSSITPLEQLTVEEVKNFVLQLGCKYEVYGDTIAGNAVDGELLASLETDEELKETLACLEITNFLHQKKLLNEWNKAKAAAGARRGETAKELKETSFSRSRSSFTAHTLTDVSEVTMDSPASVRSTTSRSGFASSSQGSLEVRRLSPEPEEEEEKEEVEKVNNIHYPVPVPLVVSSRQLETVKSFHLPKTAPLDSPELEPFHQMATEVFTGVEGSVYSGVSLLDPDGGIGVNGLSTILQGDSDQDPLKRARVHFDNPGTYEICRPFILGQTTDFRVEDVPLEVCKEGFKAGNSTYYGHIIKFQSMRIGTVCCIVEDARSLKNATQIQAILKFLAEETERQLERRQAVLDRNRNLARDIEDLKRQAQMAKARGDDRIIAPPFGPVRAVTASQVADRKTLFPYPDETASDTGIPTSPEFYRRSSNLIYWGQAYQAKPSERLHLGPDYYQPLLGFPVDPTPVGESDMERVAFVKSLGLIELDPLSTEAGNIKSLVDMTATLLQTGFVGICLLDHSKSNIFFPVMTDSKLRFFQEETELVRRHPTTGEPFWTRMDRSVAVCNYALMTPEHQSFVVHDVARDQSISFWKKKANVGFYSGAPIIIRGRAVGVLFCLNHEARPTFGRAEEVQQEQLASFIAQQYDSWSLGREMKRLEEERSRLLHYNSAPRPCLEDEKSTDSGLVLPEEYAALIVTDVQGADALRVANSDAMEQAVALHDAIVRATIADHGGFEVMNDGGTFYVAFSDVLDAVKFCLEAQEALYTAPWSEDILKLPDASEDSSRGFRGLQVRMAVHCGAVETTTDEASGRTVFAGETFNICTSLHQMGYGGQILMTCDVWNIASQFVECSLGSPQVVDQGSHVLQTKSNELQDGITIKNVLQLVPASLAFDYAQSRRLTPQGTLARVSGRVFPPVKTAKLVGRSFSDAPCGDGNVVSIVAMNTFEIEISTTDPSLVLAALVKANQRGSR